MLVIKKILKVSPSTKSTSQKTGPVENTPLLSLQKKTTNCKRNFKTFHNGPIIFYLLMLSEKAVISGLSSYYDSKEQQ